MIGKVVFLLAVVGCVLAAEDIDCKKGGEYCQNHWDCCTGTCLSYLYKCSKLQKAPSASAVPQYAPAVVSRSGIWEKEPAPLPLSTLLEILLRPIEPTTERQIDTIQQRFGGEEPKGSENTSVKPSNVEPTSTSPNTTAPSCLEIGSKCYSDKDCCTDRCHGYLHQCVT